MWILIHTYRFVWQPPPRLRNTQRGLRPQPIDGKTTDITDGTDIKEGNFIPFFRYVYPCHRCNPWSRPCMRSLRTFAEYKETDC